MGNKVRALLLGILALVGIVVATPAAFGTTPQYEVISNNTTQQIDAGCHHTGTYEGTYGVSYVRKAWHTNFQVEQSAEYCVYIAVDNTVYSNGYQSDEPEVRLKWHCLDGLGTTWIQCISFRTTVVMRESPTRYFTIGIGCNEDPNSSLAACTTSGNNDTGWLYSTTYAPFTVLPNAGYQDIMSDFGGWTQDTNFIGVATGLATTQSWNVYDVT